MLTGKAVNRWCVQHSALLVLAASAAGLWGHPAIAQSIDNLREMSIEELAQVSVTSVSKSEQPLSEAPAAIYVISREDILGSGAVTLPEMLRLAPNLQVYQTSPSKWVVTARGLNGNLTAQNFSNKLLVLVDGRTVYTPLFSGVYWDMPDVLPDEIDRIEVISGPGATLWGSNAVNGVINVITRNSSETSGFYASLRAGPERQAAGLRVSGQASADLTYSAQLRILRDGEFKLPTGADAGNGWYRIGGRVRADWTPNERDALMVAGEVFDGRVDHPGTVNEPLSGRNLTLRWQRQVGAGQIQAQVFYDRIARDERVTGGAKFHTDTLDAEIQHSFTASERHHIVWGAGARSVAYDITGSQSLYFEPARDRLFIANLFVQDNFAITPDLTLIAGLKVEHLPYAGTLLLPEARVAWKVSPTTLLWASASRAVRSPTPFDTDVEERVDIISVSGNPRFKPEKLMALELGARLQPATNLSLSATLFYHRYDDLRSIELIDGPGLLALGWDNNIEGDTYGVDAWADWRIARWWSVGAGATVLERSFAAKPGSSMILGIDQVGTDPPHWLTLRSSMTPLADLTVNFDLRAVGALRDSNVPAYVELGGRVAWQLSPNLSLSVAGVNLLNDRHAEYPGGNLIPRRVMAGAELRF